jgi:hypothetical protein
MNLNVRCSKQLCRNPSSEKKTRKLLIVFSSHMWMACRKNSNGSAISKCQDHVKAKHVDGNQTRRKLLETASGTYNVPCACGRTHLAKQGHGCAYSRARDTVVRTGEPGTQLCRNWDGARRLWSRSQDRPGSGEHGTLDLIVPVN